MVRSGPWIPNARSLTCLAALLFAPVLQGCPAGDDDRSAGDDDIADDDIADDDIADDDTGDDDTAGEIDQPPITFVLVNQTGTTLYFHWLEWWSEGINAVLSCAADCGAGWQGCRFGLPFPMDECTAQNEGQTCSGGVDSGPAVWVLPSGESLPVVWDGRLWEGDPDHCSSGVCFVDVAPHEGSYGATTSLYDDMVCIQGECKDPGPKGGLIWGAIVAGKQAYYHVEFDLPCAEKTLTLPIAEPPR